MAHHTPKLTKQVLDKMNSYTDLKWYDSSYINDECDSIEHEISEDKLITIMLPNSFIDDVDKGCFATFIIIEDDLKSQNILFESRDLNEIINHINCTL